MVTTHSVGQAEISKWVEEIRQEFGRDVVRIRYDIGEDWTGTPAIFFRVLLADRASRRDRLGRITRAISDRLWDDFRLAELGLRPYFDFRNVSEQAELKDSAWA
jgi:hypothetical protein